MISNKIDFFISYLFSLFFLVAFAFSFWLMIFSQYNLVDAPLFLSSLFSTLFFTSSMQLINHYIYYKGYDLRVKEYLAIHARAKSNIKLKVSNRPIPFTRTDGKDYVKFTFLQFFSKTHIKLIHEAPFELKFTMFLFNLSIVLQLITLFIFIVLLVNLIIFQG
jgi:hypothetical protein